VGQRHHEQSRRDAPQGEAQTADAHEQIARSREPSAAVSRYPNWVYVHRCLCQDARRRAGDKPSSARKSERSSR
jgi:hypothetical protein